MRLFIDTDPEAMGRRAGGLAARALADALAARGRATLVVATAPSQFTMQAMLLAAELDWSRIEIFHLDEYLGLGADHPASFVGILRQRFIGKLPRPPAAFHALDGKAADPAVECARLGALIGRRPVDVACIGIGENGHLAFNDPPADFELRDAYHVVELDEACRRQQVGEGWYPTLSDVPTRAISMSVRQILSAGTVVCTVPDARKAEAVKHAVEGSLTPECPASALRCHPACALCVDRAAAGELSPIVRNFAVGEYTDPT